MWAGPTKPKLLIVGEAWGEHEERLGKPFAGSGAKELWRMLGNAWEDHWPEEHSRVETLIHEDSWVQEREAWLVSAGISLTTVFNFRPPGGNIAALGSPTPSGLPPLARGSFLKEEHMPQLVRLRDEIERAKPNLILACGNTATWALLRATNIGSIRGAITESQVVGRAPLSRVWKILPTYHPVGVLRQWSWRPIVVADLMKARREMEFPEIRRPKREILVDPSLPDLLRWTTETIFARPRMLSVDIETAKQTITCIGFARAPGEALVIPFHDPRRASQSYWDTLEDELVAWECVQTLLESGIPLLGQNFLYDLQYITRMGILPRSCEHDSMLLHHSLFPEMQKGLGFLGSIYTDEPAWKLMRKRKADTEKKDE